jgi:hypothetical protein
MAAWRYVGWLGLLLVIVGATDIAANLYPFAFGIPEWEFSVVAMSFAAMPLLTVGLAAVLGSFLARGIRWGTVLIALILISLGLLVIGGLTLFLLTAPLAWNSAAATPAGMTIKKAILKTTVLGVCFGAGYLIAAVASLRQTFGRRT